MTDEEMLLQCAFQAKWSMDPSTQNGAIVVTPGGEKIAAFNSFPLGVSNFTERWRNPEKKYFVNHAERLAITRCARHGVCTSGATLYALWAACSVCAQQIVDSGISRLITSATYHYTNNESWADEIRRGEIILSEGGVTVTPIHHEEFGISLRFDKTTWTI